LASNRRDLLKALPLVATAALATPRSIAQVQTATAALTLEPATESFYEPLQQVTVHVHASESFAGTLTVLDGDGREYVRAAASKSVQFTAGGALGRQAVQLKDAQGAVAGETHFQLDCSTAVDDESGTCASLMKSVLWTMMSWNENNPVTVIRRKNRNYQFFANWVFDHTVILKGMKYFWPNVNDAIDFFADTQREDGMIWENCYSATPELNYFDWKFGYDGFVRRIESGFWQLRRAPVESHVEQYFVEGIYSTWQANGDLEWLKGKLDAAMRALRFVTRNPYRWSEKHQLVHRGFTIDTWDYVSDDQSRIGGTTFNVYPGKSEFGIFHGDNTNFVAQCRNLALMLRAAGRASEAPEFDKLAGEVEARLNKLAWNGEFFAHWIAENPGYQPDMGVDMSSQVSLSNAYALNRGIAHEKCVAILKTYQRIRMEMPTSSPGEFYGIYPPFQRGFDGSQPAMVWEYCNGGVLTVVAGELAHGAFEHGFETYGADILRRLKAIADRYHGYLPATLRGKGIDAPERSFQILPLGSAANATHGMNAKQMPVWTSNEAANLADLPVGRQEFQGIPFEILNPAPNESHTCVIVSSQASETRSVMVPVNAKATSLYLLHAADDAEELRAAVTLHYADGSSHAANVETHSWYFPADTRYNRAGPRTLDTYRVAWTKTTPERLELGVHATGVNNPFLEREIASLELRAEGARGRWLVLAATLSSAPVFFAPYDDLSMGIPDGWVGSVIYALVEGLAGVKDIGSGFDRMRLAPRWAASGEKTARVRVRYPASRGYAAYDYRYDEPARKLTIQVTSCAERVALSILLPAGKAVRQAWVNGSTIESRLERVENSRYVNIGLSGGDPQTVEIELA